MIQNSNIQKEGDPDSNVKPLVLTIWSPSGLNTAKFSLDLGKEISRSDKAVIAETCCLGIPRLGFCSGILDRLKCLETALQEFEKTGELNLAQLHSVSHNLDLLPASAFACPDYPLLARLSLETLISYPAKFVDAAKQHGYKVIIFEAQGQITSPMTFFALKNSNYIFLAANAEDLGFTLINIKRLVQVFNFPLEKFSLMGNQDLLEMSEITVIHDEDGKTVGRIRVIAQKPKEAAASVGLGLARGKRDWNILRFPLSFGKGNSDTLSEEKPKVPELHKIRL